jgi:hypothetical protein
MLLDEMAVAKKSAVSAFELAGLVASLLTSCLRA